jgi:hypothetical protein
MSAAPPRKDLPRLIQSGETLRFNQFNRWVPGAHFPGGLLFLINTIFGTRHFRGMERVAFFRNLDGKQLVLRQHERLESYRVIYYPRGFFLNLVDCSVTSVRGVVLQLDILTLNRPRTTELVWGGLSKSGRDIWCTDVVLTGIDMSNQIWMRHVPTSCFRSGVEACERWLFSMKPDDVLVKEL